MRENYEYSVARPATFLSTLFAFLLKAVEGLTPRVLTVNATRNCCLSTNT